MTTQRPPVRSGLDVLMADPARLLAGLRVGLITNHTGRDSSGTPAAQLLARAPQVRLTALFAPEHGFRGLLDDRLADDVDADTGLTIHSLYGQTLEPTPDMLDGLDALVFDIQDIGARFYTYISTLSYAMGAAGRAGLRVYVLDRPNPIGGMAVEGPVLEPELKSFVGPHEIALRHGMTVGELAGMFRACFGVACDLTVVPMEGWRRSMYYEDTGLPWIPPSPAMPSVDAGICYPGVCLLEPTNVSVGRGTPSPFEQLGAPWMDGEALAEYLNAAGLPAVRFEAVRFTPADGARHYPGVECGGVRVRVSDRDAFESVRTGLHVVCAIRQLWPDRLELPADRVDRLCGLRAVREAIEAGQPAAEIEPLLATGMASFRCQRSAHLLYADP